MRKRFKDAKMQAQYEAAYRRGPKLPRNNGTGARFWHGVEDYRRGSRKPPYPRTWIAYACWRAGMDWAADNADVPATDPLKA